MTTDRAPAAYWADICRNNLAAARRDLCSHGVTPANCRELHDLARREDTDTEPEESTDE